MSRLANNVVTLRGASGRHHPPCYDMQNFYADLQLLCNFALSNLNHDEITLLNRNIFRRNMRS